MTFFAGADAYDRFMGRYSRPLAPVFASYAGVTTGQHVLDVGCGPGALTTELVARVGAANVSAVDPTDGFVAAARQRHPGVDVRHASAEALPFADDAFDAAVAQLVVHFMGDPVAGLREMARVVRPGGVVAACVWDYEEQGPLTPFWAAARELDPDAEDEVFRAGARQGHLAGLFADAGIADVEDTRLVVQVEHPTFEDWWEPFTLGVGPAGQHVAALDEAGRVELRERCRRLFATEPFTVTAGAWTARGHVQS
jgi:SAM-dependent methyltransferase